MLADEKVALGVRAFRCVRMTPAQVDADSVLADNGKGTPRVLILNPAKPEKVKVLEAKDLKASKLFKAMKSTSNKFWKQKLDKVVKTHMSLLTEQDQLANAEKTISDKLARVGDDDKKAKKVKEEQAEIRAQLKEIKDKELELWKLTRKA